MIISYSNIVIFIDDNRGMICYFHQQVMAVKFKYIFHYGFKSDTVIPDKTWAGFE